jgi:hypothetical protein
VPATAILAFASITSASARSFSAWTRSASICGADPTSTRCTTADSRAASMVADSRRASAVPSASQSATKARTVACRMSFQATCVSTKTVASSARAAVTAAPRCPRTTRGIETVPLIFAAAVLVAPETLGFGYTPATPTSACATDSRARATSRSGAARRAALNASSIDTRASP